MILPDQREQTPDQLWSAQKITDGLSARLTSIGVRDSWMLEQAGIYAATLETLYAHLNQSVNSLWLHQNSLQELSTLRFGLEQLFNGRTSLIKTSNFTEDKNRAFFQGTFKDTNGENKGIKIYQLLRDTPSRRDGEEVHSNCQIHIVNELGRDHLGRKRFDKTSAIRCGLRYRDHGNSTRWSISVDSGSFTNPNPAAELVLRPLSRAIFEAGIFQSLNKPYTYHFTTPEVTEHGSKRQLAAARLRMFNGYLHEVFLRMSEETTLHHHSETPKKRT